MQNAIRITLFMIAALLLSSCSTSANLSDAKPDYSFDAVEYREIQKIDDGVVLTSFEVCFEEEFSSYLNRISVADKGDIQRLESVNYEEMPCSVEGSFGLTDQSDIEVRRKLINPEFCANDKTPGNVNGDVLCLGPKGLFRHPVLSKNLISP